MLVRERNEFFPLASRHECSPADTLIQASWSPFWTPDPQESKIMRVCGVTAKCVTRTSYRSPKKLMRGRTPGDGKAQTNMGYYKNKKSICCITGVTRKLQSDKEEAWQQPEHESQADWHGGVEPALSEKPWVVLAEEC